MTVIVFHNYLLIFSANEVLPDMSKLAISLARSCARIAANKRIFWLTSVQSLRHGHWINGLNSALHHGLSVKYSFGEVR